MKNRSGDPVIARDPVICAAPENPSLCEPITGPPLVSGPRRFLGLGRIPITGSPDHLITGFCRAVWRTFAAVIREIFDETAYERFLARTHAARSVRSYRDFLGDREAAMARRPRCC